MAGFESGIFLSGRGRDDHYAASPRHKKIIFIHFLTEPVSARARTESTQLFEMQGCVIKIDKSSETEGNFCINDHFYSPTYIF
jgi:hypothetical protein